MAVFTQASHTLTEFGDQLGQADHSLKAKYGGSAPMDNSITSDGWLPGTKGAHCELMKGDHWHEIQGNVTERVSEKKTSTYGGEFAETYNDDVTRHMYGGTTETHFGTKSTTCCASEDKTNTDLMQSVIGAFTQYGQQSVSQWINNTSISFIGGNIQVIGFNISALTEISFVTTELDIKALVFKARGQKFDAKACEDNFRILEGEINALNSNVMALKFGAKVSKATLGAFDLDSAIHLAPVHVAP